MEEGSVKSSATEYKDHEITVKSEEEFKGETEEKTKEEEEDNPKHLDAFPHYEGIRSHSKLDYHEGQKKQRRSHSTKSLDEKRVDSSKNYVRKFLRALHPKWRAKFIAIEESKDLTSLSLDELIGNLKVHKMIIKKDFEIVKAKVERKSLALKAKKESSDEECSTFGSEDEEYAMAVKHFKKFFKRIDKNQRAFIGGSWSDSGEEDDEKVNNKTCLVAQASSEVCSESSYFSDENSSINDLVLDHEYDKLCKMILKIITKNKRLKATRDSLEKEISTLKEKVSTLEKNKEVDLECLKCHMLKIENEKLKEEALKLTKFEKSTHCLNEMLNNQKPSGEKLGLWFNSFEASSSGTKEIKFVKAKKKEPSDGGLIIMGCPQSVQAAPKTIMGPPPVGTPGSEKNVSFQKSVLGPRPKHIIVNNVRVLVASNNEVKPLSKPGVGFSKPNFGSKTPPPRRVRRLCLALKPMQPKENWSTKSTSWFSCNLEQLPTTKLHAMGNVSSISTSQPIASNARDV
ncbi:hypothetical protein Tco_1056247 [Tanacetum coccineum]|uniref:Uncharacterized protein n=1 Tax=Tanacetum coccineum TaxID=301880 RepID=A0ABQ5H1Y9_9ASTR